MVACFTWISRARPARLGQVLDQHEHALRQGDRAVVEHPLGDVDLARRAAPPAPSAGEMPSTAPGRVEAIGR